MCINICMCVLGSYVCETTFVDSYASVHVNMRVYTVAMCACACVSVWHILHHVYITHVYIVAF